jgi:hypothetical protein
VKVDETDSPDNTTVVSHLTTANSSTVFHDSTRPPSKISGHCLENDAGSQLDSDTKYICHSPEAQVIRFFSTSFFPTPLRVCLRVCRVCVCVVVVRCCDAWGWGCVSLFTCCVPVVRTDCPSGCV